MSLYDRVQEQTVAIDTNREDIIKYTSLMRDALIQRLGLVTVSDLITKDEARARMELEVAASSIVHLEPFVRLEPELVSKVINQAINAFCGFGQIQELLDDPQVTEIMINGPQHVFFEKQGRIEPYTGAFESKEQVMMMLDRILAPLGRRLDRAQPLVNARLPNGDRVHAVSEPIALDGPIITIRKFSRKLFRLKDLQASGMLTKTAAHKLIQAVRDRQNIAVVGPTGSGKTTFLNALSQLIPDHERIVTIEDSAELQFLTHPNVVRLEARTASIEGTGEITIRELVKNALRMRPDRIVVGEVRGEECIDMLQAMNTGHRGCMTTLHAGSPVEAILRLVMMARFAMDLPTDLIEEQIGSAFDLIVMTDRIQGKRKVKGLYEVSYRHGALKLHPLEDTWALRMQELGQYADTMYDVDGEAGVDDDATPFDDVEQNDQELEEPVISFVHPPKQRFCRLGPGFSLFPPQDDQTQEKTEVPECKPIPF